MILYNRIFKNDMSIFQTYFAGNWQNEKKEKERFYTLNTNLDEYGAFIMYYYHDGGHI